MVTPIRQRPLRPVTVNTRNEKRGLRSLTGLVHAVAVDYEVGDDPNVSAIAGALRAGQYARAVAAADKILEQQYEDAGQYFPLCQIANLVRKVPFSDPLLDPESRARQKFEASELRCKRINARLSAARWGRGTRHEEVFRRARSYIERIIGDEPDLHLVYAGCGFGPGANVGVSGNATHYLRKLEEGLSASPSAAPYLIGALWANAQTRELLLQHEQFRSPGRILSAQTRLLFRRRVGRACTVVGYNKIAFVPKTAKVHRTIAIEPSGNAFLQKGIDIFLRSCLKRAGIDLSDQSRNQRMAWEGSLGGENPFATLDLSAASDSISIELVKTLLPPAWYCFLDDLRSPSYVIDGAPPKRYHKFASMGNGFCFPLETLIFASLAHACGTFTGDGDFSVYGDDIIVRQGVALYLTEVLNWCGFSLNRSKSFIHGPFRESCGADFWGGINVRPYVLDFIPASSREWIKVCNGFWSVPYHRAQKAWEYAHDQVDPSHRLYRPEEGNPDGAITVDLDTFMASKSARWNRSMHRWNWREYRDEACPDTTPYRLRDNPAANMYGLLYGLSPSLDGAPELPLRRKTRTTTGWVLPVYH